MLMMGIDIEKIDRFKKLTPTSGFVKKYFTPEEIKYCFSNPKPWEHLAARFAAKEAVIKALPTNEKIFYSDIEIKKDKNNKPRIAPSKALKKYMSTVSITHSSTDAAAAVILWKRK